MTKFRQNKIQFTLILLILTSLILILMTVFAAFIVRAQDETGNVRLEQSESQTAFLIRDCLECPAMQLIPNGSFVMGALPYDKAQTKNEHPYHSVQIKNDFYMGKYEVTFGEFLECFNQGGCDFKPKNLVEECAANIVCRLGPRSGAIESRNLPVVGVSAMDALQYVNWLSKKTSQSYRLPTEEEWEYTARAGTKTIYWWGDELNDEINTCVGRFCQATTFSARVPLEVGYYAPNPFNVYDTTGSVSELIGGCFMDKNSIKIKNEIDIQCQRVLLKGGGAGEPEPWQRISSRLWVKPNNRASEGFRVARELN